jgi:4-hydroxybenzoate polyprenyltransferase
LPPEAKFSEATPDAVPLGFVERLPARFRPYARLARLDRPIGWWLLLLPCWWSEMLAARLRGDFPSLLTLILFFIGAVAMRGAGSTWNDISDRDLDAQVARTRHRPLPSGQVSTWQAFVFLALQLLVGVAVLLSFNGFAIRLGLLSLVPVVVYPFMKRFTNHPQLVLGLAFAWGALMGFATHLSYMPLAGLLLYAGAFAWVVGYDTIYALQDIEDDAIVGIGSTARAYEHHIRAFVGGLYALCFSLVSLSLLSAGVGVLAYAGLLAFGAHLAWQVIRVDRQDGARALHLFRSNRDAGLLLCAGLALDALLKL